MPGSIAIEVQDASRVGEARRAVATLASRVGLDETEAGQASIIVSEMAQNLVKHTPGGEIILRALSEYDFKGIEILSIDKGPGFNVVRCLRDGYSSAGTAGTGLGAISRLSSVFEIFSNESGTVVFSQLWHRAKRQVKRSFVAGAVSVAMRGQEVSGDSWAVVQNGSCAKVLVVDGLGHGMHAAEAARTAVEVFKSQSRHSPDEIVKAVHEALRSTRGGAVAVLDIDTERRLLRYVAVGNISGTVIDHDSKRNMISQSGTAGADIHRLHEFQYPWSNTAVVVLHSDGLTSRWRLESYPGLQLRHPSVIAAVLYRDFQRGRDDVSVLALREDHND